LHELSIAQSLVTIAEEAIRQQADSGVDTGGGVSEVHLRLGVLAGVVKESLLFCYDIATENSLLEGSSLVIHQLPVVVYCDRCEALVELPGIQRFRCPKCDTPSGDIRQGREMELASIHFHDVSNSL
jgi:hydrogenase nickel incorporation protein HypA/HybF